MDARKPPASATLRKVIGLVWAEADGFTLRTLGLSFVLVIASSALAAVTPIFFKLIVDAFSGHPPENALLTPAVLIALYVVAQYTLRAVAELRSLTHGQGVQRVNRRLSQHLFGHIVRLPMRFHLDRKTGAIGETLGQGLNGCQILLQHLVFTFLPIAVEFLAITIALLHFGHDRYLAIFALSAMAYTVAFWKGATGISQPSHAVSKAHIETHAVLTDSLLNYETVKYFGAEPDIGGRYEKALVEQESTWRRLLRKRTGNGLLVATIFAVSFGSSLGLAGGEVLAGTMTVGDFVLIASYSVRLMQPLETIGFAIRDVSQGLAYVRAMLEMLREPRETDRASRDSAFEARGELTFEHVDFSYQSERSILRNISFKVAQGKTTAIVGVSGSGKSSLIRLLFRLYEPDDGRILLDGKPIQDIPLAQLRQSIAIVPQDTVLFNDSIGKNIGFGRREATQQDIENAARLAHLHDFIKGLPEGYDTPVGERGLKLSGGEKQRVAIARAALKHPRIFVFDEATSSLDSKTEREILQNLIEVARSCTTVVIAHRLSTVVHADEILVLHQGSIVERGTHAQLLERNDHYEALWRAQQGDRPKPGLAQTVAPAH